MFKFGGDDLDKITNEIKKTYNSSPGKSLKNKYKDLYFDTFIVTLLPILKCLVKIVYYGYLHSDIKPPNILYNIQNNRMYLIDFGLLQRQIYISQSSSTLSFKYLYYPPEFVILYNLRFGMRDPQRLYDNILENFEYYDYERYMTFLDFAKYKTKLKAFITYAVSISLEKFEKDFLATYIKKLDIYSLGMSLMEIIYIMKTDNTLKIHNHALYDSFIKNIIIDMIHPDPRYRYTPDEAYIRLGSLYRNHTIKVQDTNIVKYLNMQNLQNIANRLKVPIITTTDKHTLYKSIITQLHTRKHI
jgi:serine/threonine protein kinase